MSGFTKLASSLPASSLWNQPDHIRIVFITMLSMADKDGNVKGSIIGISHLSREPIEVTEQAITVLESPDPFSGCKDEEGRRIVRIDGGWHLVTHKYYRQQGMDEAAKAWERTRKQKYRDLHRSRTVPDKKRMSRSVPDMLGTDMGTGNGSVQEEGVSKREPSTQKEVEDFCESLGLPRSDGEAMWLDWKERGMGKTRDWKAKIRKWKIYHYLPSQKNQQDQFRFKKPDPNADRKAEKSEREAQEAREKLREFYAKKGKIFP